MSANKRRQEEQHQQELKQHQDHQDQENSDGKVIQERDQMHQCVMGYKQLRNEEIQVILASMTLDGNEGSPSKGIDNNILESPQPDINPKDLYQAWVQFEE